MSRASVERDFHAREHEHPWHERLDSVIDWIRDFLEPIVDDYGAVFIDAKNRLTPYMGQLPGMQRSCVAVEFGASLGYSTIHIASALHDVGHGSLISTELSEEKAREAHQNLEDAGVAGLVDIRVGDAMKTLTNLNEDVDMLFLDGWNDLYLPLLMQLEPLLSADVFVIADMSEGDPHHDRYREHVNDPANRYTSIELPLGARVVISTRRVTESSDPPAQRPAVGLPRERSERHLQLDAPLVVRRHEAGSLAATGPVTALLVRSPPQSDAFPAR